jgi:hypothetical protein
LDFKEDLKALGFKVGKVATFLKNIAPAGRDTATPPKMDDGATFCLNWHNKGHCWSHCDNLNLHQPTTESELFKLVQFMEEGLAQSCRGQV